MQINAIEGIVEHGQIRLLEPTSLPENTKVYVIVAEPNQGASARLRTPRLAQPEQSRDFRKQIVEVSPNAEL